VRRQIADTMSPQSRFGPTRRSFYPAAAAARRDFPLWLASDPVITQRCPPFIGFLSEFHINANEVGEEFILEHFGR